MADLKLDLTPLIQYVERFKKTVVSDVKKSIESLAKDGHNHITEKAQNKLHSFRDEYLKSLNAPHQIDDFVWMITLEDKAEWIETGRDQPFDMKPGLLNTVGPGKKPAKEAKDGSRYRVVPMNQGKTPSQMSSGNKGYEQNMVNLLKSELKKKGIPYKKLEIDPRTGSPRLGKLHSLDIDSYIPGKGNTPQLKGVTIYQTKQKDGSVKRSITTFRTVTDKPDQKDKWIHPPVEAKNFFEETRVWLENEWQSKILPSLLDKYK